MPRPSIQRQAPPEHLVVLDSNILWCEDKSIVVATELEEFWSSHAPEFALTLVVPEVVRGELLFQQTTSALKALAKANAEFERLSAVAGERYAHRVTEQRVRQGVEARLDRWLQQRRARIEPTPIAAINWSRLISDAIWRNAPFEQDPKNQDFEKGFRDALVLETVRHLSTSNTPPRRLAFITADGVLREATAVAVSAQPRSVCYESLAELSSYLRLTKERLDEQFVAAIQTRATKRFLSRGDQHSLYYEAAIREEIRARFAADFAKPAPENDEISLFASASSHGVQWDAVTNESIRIHAAQFDHLEGSHQFFWKTPVKFRQCFRCSWPPSEALQGVKFPERLRTLTFDVMWKSRVKSDGRFHDLAVVDFNRSAKQFTSFDERELRLLGLRPLERPTTSPGGGVA